MDKIILKNLRCHGRVGVLEEEKRLGQTFLVNIEMMVDLAPAGRSDDLKLSVNYAEVFELAKTLIGASRCDLIETYGEQLAGEILSRYEIVSRVIVQVEKPDAPIEGEFESVGVVIDRSRDA